MKRLKCWFLKKRLFSYAVGELEKTEAEKVKKHITACSKCSQYVSQVQKIGKLSQQREQLFLNEVFWRKFDERLDLALAGELMGQPEIKLHYLRPLPKLAMGTAAALCILLVFVLLPSKKYLKNQVAFKDKDLIETALLIEDEATVYFNSDEDAYVEELLLELELDRL